MSMLAASLSILMAAAPTTSDEARLRSIVTCAAPRRTEQMETLLNTQYDNEYQAAANSIAELERCVRSDDDDTLLLNAALGDERGKFRGYVAETLIAQSKAPVPQPMAQQRFYASGWFIQSGRPRAVDEMAVCVAATNPAGIKALLATSPGSKDQRGAFTNLRPSLVACLAKGYQLDTKPTGLRAALAEALFHRMSSAASAGSGNAR